MKNIFFLIPLIIPLFACENIGEDERYIEVDRVESQRRVLLEEFTGQRCTNCPAAHKIIEKLEEQYGEDLVVVSIHAGPFGIEAPNGLMQPEGDIYAGKWGVSAYPCGIVDRNSGVLTDNEWATAIRNEIVKGTNLSLDLEASLSPSGDMINISTTLLSSGNVSGNLQLWITEDEIVGFQIDGSQRFQDYVHNNVFRTCANGTWGEPISLAANVYDIVENSVLVDGLWNVDYLNVVGFVYNDSGVVQVAKCKVKTTDN